MVPAPIGRAHVRPQIGQRVGYWRLTQRAFLTRRSAEWGSTQISATARSGHRGRRWRPAGPRSLQWLKARIWRGPRHPGRKPTTVPPSPPGDLVSHAGAPCRGRACAPRRQQSVRRQNGTGLGPGQLAMRIDPQAASSGAMATRTYRPRAPRWRRCRSGSIRPCVAAPTSPQVEQQAAGAARFLRCWRQHRSAGAQYLSQRAVKPVPAGDQAA